MVMSRRMVREIGTALAVLALYLLILLIPLHQARATQLDFAALGYQTIESNWVTCGTQTDGNSSQALLNKCPIAGLAKQQLAPPGLIPIAFGSAAPMGAVVYGIRPRPLADPHHNPAAPPRGPPALA